MAIELKKDAAYSLLFPTSMGVRLTPVDGQPFHCSETFKMQVTSAETNVASVVSYLGLPVKVLTAFVKDSPVARMIKDNLAGRHMDYEGPEFEQEGPWGVRHQFNLADSGYGSRGPRVQNDRAGEVGRLLNVKDFDLDRIFGKEGVQIVHLSGLIAALSPETSKFCLEIARTAKKYGSRISFDLNYRASFWKGREEELSAIFAEIASLADILIGNEEDFQLCLKIKGPEAGGKDISAKIENFKEMVKDHDVKKTFWQRALVFVSKDADKTKADVQYLEHKAITVAKSANSYVLNENKQTPKAPNLPEYQRDAMDEFFEDIQFLSSFMGCNIFEISQPSADLFFYTKGRGCDAKGFYNANGFTVLKGSIIAPTSVPSLKWCERRQKMVSEYTVIESGKHVMTSDKTFTSPSTAADFCIGSSNNGWLVWKDAEGNTLDSVFRKQLD